MEPTKTLRKGGFIARAVSTWKGGQHIEGRCPRCHRNTRFWVRWVAAFRTVEFNCTRTYPVIERPSGIHRTVICPGTVILKRVL